MYAFYESPSTLDEALALKAQHGPLARIMAGGTDLILEMERGVRRAPDGGELGVIDLSRVPGLSEIDDEEGWIHLGPLVTHNQVVVSAPIVANAFLLARACWEIGAPQIRNRGTVAGNIITASPANDAIVPLMALDATVTVASAARGERTLPLAEFSTGFRQVDLADDEILTRISIPKLGEDARGTFIKLGLRRAQAISLVSVAVIIEEGEDGLADARISLGAVTPVIARAREAEAFLRGKQLTDEVIDEAARLAVAASSPIDDIRASAAYRREMVGTLTRRALRQLRDGREREGWPEKPILLWGEHEGRWPARNGTLAGDPEKALVNGEPVTLTGGQTLLDSLREAGLTGVKEGCAEGECGACTVYLDGVAVLACMTPAERAAGSQVVTVEGLGDPQHLAPVQEALVEAGGVQCGYCTPGFVMSAAKLLEERPDPTREEAAVALTGNFCRCTGYVKIIDAVMLASEKKREPHDS
jgi:carbon-monoxide dehydrogenase medium subunit